MIKIMCKQNSPEWWAEKLGKPSASHFDNIMTSRGEVSKSRQGYLYELAAQIVSGIRPETFTSSAMEEGTRREPESRALYEMLYDVSVEQVGICFPDEWKLYSCSPDGIINDYRGLELKNVLPKTQVEYLLGGTLPAKYHGQVQGSLLVTGFDRWDFLSYSPGLPPLIVEVHRDEAYISKLAVALDDFAADLQRTVAKLRAIK